MFLDHFDVFILKIKNILKNNHNHNLNGFFENNREKDILHPSTEDSIMVSIFVWFVVVNELARFDFQMNDFYSYQNSISFSASTSKEK
jgi:hypothetical protein